MEMEWHLLFFMCHYHCFSLQHNFFHDGVILGEREQIRITPVLRHCCQMGTIGHKCVDWRGYSHAVGPVCEAGNLLMKC